MNANELNAMTTAELVARLEECDRYITSRNALIKSLKEQQLTLKDEIIRQCDWTKEHHIRTIELPDKKG